MGLRKIEDDIDLKEAMKRKAAELKIKEMKEKAKTENLTKERIAEIAKRHGVILALTPELRDGVKDLIKTYNIPSSRVIMEEITEHDVLKKFSKVDVKKLGMLAYQRVLLRKEETGGIMPISEVFDLVNTGILRGNVEIKDVQKAMKALKKDGVIEDIRELESGITMIHFFPVQYTSDQVKVMQLAKEKGYITLEDVCTGLNWAQDRALRALKTLQETGVAKFRESILTGKEWFFPSI